MPTTEPTEHSSEYVKQRKSEKEPKQKKAIHSLGVFPAKSSLFTLEFIITKLLNYFRTLSVLLLPNFD